jgi:hypothetical protein
MDNKNFFEIFFVIFLQHLVRLESAVYEIL